MFKIALQGQKYLHHDLGINIAKARNKDILLNTVDKGKLLINDIMMPSVMMIGPDIVERGVKQK